MSVGSVLVGIASALIVGAYLARPFRVAKATADIDQVIETWVAYVRGEGEADGLTEEDLGPVSFCPQCGRRVGPDDRFCASCGVRLNRGAE